MRKLILGTLDVAAIGLVIVFTVFGFFEAAIVVTQLAGVGMAIVGAFLGGAAGFLCGVLCSGGILALTGIERSSRRNTELLTELLDRKRIGGSSV